MEPAATPEAAWVMQRHQGILRMTGKKVGFKVAGGIVRVQMRSLYCHFKEYLGEEWLHPHLFRIGASRLANNLNFDNGRKISYFRYQSKRK